MGPVELDDLLASIRAESKPKNDSALKLYSGTRQDQLVTEIIDERILNLLGLQEVFDIDYATYISLLREKAGAARMGSRKFSTEEAELITNEFRRVKRKVGRFKLQKKKINAQNIAIRAPISSVSPKALMPTTGAAQPQQPIVQELIPPVTSIDNKLNELLSVLREDFKKEEKNGNIVGYQIQKNQCLDCPYSQTLLGTYSKYTYKPQQQIFFDNEMVGDTAKIMIETKFNSDIGIREIVKKEFKIIFE